MFHHRTNPLESGSETGFSLSRSYSLVIRKMGLVLLGLSYRQIYACWYIADGRENLETNPYTQQRNVIPNDSSGFPDKLTVSVTDENPFTELRRVEGQRIDGGICEYQAVS